MWSIVGKFWPLRWPLFCTKLTRGGWDALSQGPWPVSNWRHAFRTVRGNGCGFFLAKKRFAQTSSRINKAHSFPICSPACLTSWTPYCLLVTYLTRSLAHMPTKWIRLSSSSSLKESFKGTLPKFESLQVCISLWGWFSTVSWTGHLMAS